MSQQTKTAGTSRKSALIGGVLTLLGLILFVYFIWKTGPAELAAHVSRIGAGFLLVLAVSFVRPAVRALAWTLCFEPPHRLTFRDALRAYVAGDAAGNLVPLGVVVSEPAKAAFVRDRVPLSVGFSAIAVEYLFYSLSVIIFIFAGAGALLLIFPLPRGLRWATIGTLIGVAVVAFVGFAIIRLRWRFLSGALEALYGRGIGRRALETRRERARALEDRVYGFYARNRRRFVPILLLEACFHLSGILETYVILLFISDVAPTLLAAFVLESVNRIINVVFKAIPFRVGVDEAGMDLLMRVLQFGAASGVALALIRKGRVLCWTALGLAFLAGRGWSRGTAEREAQMVVEVLPAPELASPETGIEMPDK